MRCQECLVGVIDIQNHIILKTDCISRTAYPCVNCGLLHYILGNEKYKSAVMVKNLAGEKTYWIKEQTKD